MLFNAIYLDKNNFVNKTTRKTRVDRVDSYPIYPKKSGRLDSYPPDLPEKNRVGRVDSYLPGCDPATHPTIQFFSGTNHCYRL
jgi:hypothetical protein